jgi:hypothetical protein
MANEINLYAELDTAEVHLRFSKNESDKTFWSKEIIRITKEIKEKYPDTVFA